MKSKAIAALLLLGVIILLCCTFPLRSAWWSFTDIFCLFMAVFLHLIALIQPPALHATARRLDNVAFGFAIAGAVALLAEAILFLSLG